MTISQLRHAAQLTLLLACLFGAEAATTAWPGLASWLKHGVLLFALLFWGANSVRMQPPADGLNIQEKTSLIEKSSQDATHNAALTKLMQSLREGLGEDNLEAVMKDLKDKNFGYVGEPTKKGKKILDALNTFPKGKVCVSCAPSGGGNALLQVREQAHFFDDGVEGEDLGSEWLGCVDVPAPPAPGHVAPPVQPNNGGFDQQPAFIFHNHQHFHVAQHDAAGNIGGNDGGNNEAGFLFIGAVGAGAAVVQAVNGASAATAAPAALSLLCTVM